MPIYALDDVEPQVHPTAYVHPDAVLVGDVRLGPESSVWPGAVLRADYGHIVVGARTSVQDGSVLHTTQEWPTLIGADCVVGHNAHLEGCTVEDRCLVGSGSVVLNRAVGRTGSVVGAQALVPEGLEVPPGHLAVGVPARPRPLDPATQAQWIDFAVREYTTNAQRYRTGLRLVGAGVRAQQEAPVTQPEQHPHDGPHGRPAAELSDDELAAQGKQAHDTRNWVFLHGSAEQFRHHTARMLELEDEYLRRFPQRTWQGVAGAGTPAPSADPERAFLQRVADAPGGRMHRLEAHQAAREVGLDRASVARLYSADPPLLGTDRQDRVITDAGRARLRGD